MTKNNDTCRADSPSNKDCRNIHYVGGCPIFKGVMAGRIRENEPKQGNPLFEVGKGPVKLINTVGENSSFTFTVCVKSVPHYHFKVACIVLQIAVNEVFETHSKNGEIGHINQSLLAESF